MELRFKKSRCIFTSAFILFLSVMFLMDLPNKVYSFLEMWRSGEGFLETLISDTGVSLVLLLIIMPIFGWLLKLYLWDGLITRKVFFKISPDGIWYPMVKDNYLIPWSDILEIQFDKRLSIVFSGRAHKFKISRESYVKYCKPSKIFGFKGDPQLMVGAFDRDEERIKFEINKNFPTDV